MHSKSFFAIALLLSGTAATAAFAQETKTRSFSTLPGSKMAIEVPLKRVISTGSSPIGPLANTSPSLAPAARPSSFSKPSADKSEARLEGNHVQAGLVNWAPNAAVAYQRAGKSGKPVLVFQMIGKLDDEFC